MSSGGFLVEKLLLPGVLGREMKYFEPPDSGGPGRFGRLFMSHPPLDERIEALKRA